MIPPFDLLIFVSCQDENIYFRAWESHLKTRTRNLQVTQRIGWPGDIRSVELNSAKGEAVVVFEDEEGILL